MYGHVTLLAGNLNSNYLFIKEEAYRKKTVDTNGPPYSVM